MYIAAFIKKSRAIPTGDKNLSPSHPPALPACVHVLSWCACLVLPVLLGCARCACLRGGARWIRTRGTKTGCMDTRPQRPIPHVLGVEQPRLDVRHHAMPPALPPSPHAPFTRHLLGPNGNMPMWQRSCRTCLCLMYTRGSCCHPSETPTAVFSLHSLGCHREPSVERSPSDTGGNQSRFTHGEHGTVVSLQF